MRNRVIALVAALVALCCTPAVTGAARPSAVHGSKRSPRLTAAQSTADFGIDLLRRLPRGNLVFSPSSIATALAMAGEGARGATASQIARVLHLSSPAEFSNLGVLDRALMTGLRNRGRSEPEAPRLEIANGLFVQQGFGVRTPFLAALQGSFGAAPQRLDFMQHPQAATNRINEWVSRHTEGVINRLLSGLPASTKLVLANAIYLDARWAEEFNGADVFSEPFHTPHGSADVPFMHKQEVLRYGAGPPGYRAVEIPYRSSTLSLLVVLPDGSDTSKLEHDLTAQRLGALAAGMRPRVVELALPKFHIGFQQELQGVLSRLGMPLAFGPGAAFSGISRTALAVSQAIHAADIRVNETGTVATAVTVLLLEPLGHVHGLEPTPFDADRPFLFFLRDDRTGAVLFAGRLSDAVRAQA